MMFLKKLHYKLNTKQTSVLENINLPSPLDKV